MNFLSKDSGTGKLGAGALCVISSGVKAGISDPYPGCIWDPNPGCIRYPDPGCIIPLSDYPGAPLLVYSEDGAPILDPDLGYMNFLSKDSGTGKLGAGALCVISSGVKAGISDPYPGCIWDPNPGYIL